MNMVSCKDCIHERVCVIKAFPDAFENTEWSKEPCDHFESKSEGEWKFHKDGSGTCSECHITQKNIWDYDNWQNFCGHCGAKMTKGE